MHNNYFTYGIDLQPNDRFGWGVACINTLVELMANGKTPVLTRFKIIDPTNLPTNPFIYSTLIRINENKIPDFPIYSLHGVFNHFVHEPFADMKCKKRVALMIFEDTACTTKQTEESKLFDFFITSSIWNKDVLESAGIKSTVVHQGIDPAIFHPAPKRNVFKNRFAIFSGGRLTFRKGQDITIEAFKRFREKHPEALLVCSWHNQFVSTIRGIESKGYVDYPELSNNNDQELSLYAWLIDNGLDEDSLVILPEIPNSMMAEIIRECNVGIALSRAEGGTNLVAMECLACGIPMILSGNTGHTDLNDNSIIKFVISQGVVTPGNSPFTETFGWGESDPDEAVEALEDVYTNYSSYGVSALTTFSNMVTNWSWEVLTKQLIEAVESE